MEIVEKNYELGALLNDVVTMMDLKAVQKNLHFETQVSENLPNALIGDDTRIKQILLNLLNNAVKYTRKGSVKLKVSGLINEQRDAVRLQMSVEDTGIGIQQEDIAGLFEGFQRLDLENNRDIEGTGLGLAITQRLAVMMDGKIEVESIYGQGSVFTLHLTQKISSAEPVGDFKKRYRAQQSPSYKYNNVFTAPEATILVVDDNQMNLLVVKNLLKKTLVQITTCMSGTEALELMEQNKYDIVLLDHMMPGMDGIATLKRAKQMENNQSKDATIIALTANAISGVREMYLAEGFDDYMSKPIDGTQLEEKLVKYLPVQKVTPCQKETEREAVQDSVQEQEESLIDFELGIRYCADSEELYLEILEMFYQMFEANCAELERCVKQEDWNNYTVNIHALKSNALNVGAKELSKQCLQLELAGKRIRTGENVSEDTIYIQDNHKAVMQLYEEVIRVVSEYIKDKKG